MMDKRLYIILWVMALMGVDLWSKQLAHARIAPFESIDLLPFLSLVNVRNKGAAFGMMSGMGNAFFVVASIFAIAVILWMMAKSPEHKAPLVLILTGALGNMIDRLALGYVRDFVDFHVGDWHWPAFNAADSYLTIGVALVILMPAIEGLRGGKSQAGR